MPAKFVQHHSPQSNRAKAPYNFVPLPEKVMSAEEFKAHDKYDPDRYTGYIDLDITTETPLYTRCAIPTEVWSKYQGSEYFENDKPKVTAIRECQDFFHHGNKEIPVIPGSTLRGMTRALVEILGYGKMNFITNKRLVYRSVSQRFYREQFSKMRNGALDYPVSNLKAGYLETNNGEYYIRPALTDSDGNSFVHIEDSKFADKEPNRKPHKVYDGFFVEPPTDKTERLSSNRRVRVRLRFAISDRIERSQFVGSKKVSIVCSGDMPGKHMHYAIYEPNNSIPLNQLIKIDDDLWKTYQADLELSRGIETRELKVGKPLFYLMDNKDLTFFGPTMMFRLPYKNSTQEFVPEILRCPTEIDLAEAIFGMVGEKSISGRVFFSDAICCSTENPFYDNNKEGRFVPKILSSPKPTSFQLYLCQPEINHQQDLKNYNDSETTVIRGSKRYWHKKEFDFEERAKTINYDSQKDTYTIEGTQHTIIRPVKPKTSFKGKVYFENLSELELGALLTALDLPETMRHQIGMAKPYGLGSVQIKPTLILQDRKARYSSFLDEKDNDWSNDKQSPDEINQTKEQAKECFKAAVVKHYQGVVQSPKAIKFREIPRLQALAAMLEWQDADYFYDKEYADLENPMWSERHVLPHPQTVERLNEPPIIQVVNPTLWAEKCANHNQEEAENQIEEKFEISPVPLIQTPTVSLALINLPPNKVASELHQHYQDWLNVTDEHLKLEMAKVIADKGRLWSNAKKKDWYNKVVEFVEKHK